MIESPSSNLDRSLLGAQTFRDAQSVGYGPLIMQIPIRAFFEIGSVYRFRQSNESPYYNGGIKTDNYVSLNIYGRQSEDGDDDEGAMAFSLGKPNAVLVSS